MNNQKKTEVKFFTTRLKRETVKKLKKLSKLRKDQDFTVWSVQQIIQYALDEYLKQFKDL